MRRLPRSFKIGLAILIAVSGCTDIGPGFLDPDSCPNAGCEPEPFVYPGSGYILRGDTIRLTSCTRCPIFGTDTANVVSRWSVPDAKVVSLAEDGLVTLIPAATNVLVRGIARGRARVSVTMPKGDVKFAFVTVADSTDITSIELSTYGFTDTLRVGKVQTFDVYLMDASRNIYRAKPTAWSVSDTTVLQLTGHPSGIGTLTLRAQGRNPGQVDLQATFHGRSAKRHITVVP